MESDTYSRLVSSSEEEILNNVPQSPNLNAQTKRQNIFLATFAAELYIVALGMVSAYSSPACADMKRPGSRFIDISFNDITWIASLPMLSGIFGNALSGYLSHRFGRKATLMYVSVPYTLSWLMIAYAPNLTFIYVGRIMSGISAGISAVAVPSYIVELSTVEIRGLLTATFQAAVALGTFIMTSFGIFLRWSWLAILGAVIVVSGTCLLYLMPESPPWLIKTSRYGEAVEGIRFLKGKNHDAIKELEEIVQQLEDEPKSSFCLSELFNPGLYKPLLIAAVLMLSMSFCGFPAIVSYSVQVFQTTGSSVTPNVAATIVVMLQLMSTLVSSLLMDKVGRKVLYIISGSAMTLSLTIIGLYSYFAPKYSVSELVHWTWIPLFSLLAYLSTFSLGFGPVPFVVIPELVPTANRSFVMAVACFIGSLSGFLITKIFNIMQNSIGLHGTFWTYGLFSFFGTLFYWIFIPETKGRMIHDIHKSFSVAE